MTKFSDQLFDDLMREHGRALAHIARPAAARRHVTPRRALLAAGGGGLAAAAIAGTLVAGGSTPAYAVTKNPDGTVTLAVYQKSGIAGANARLRDMGDKRVVVVPVQAGCPRLDSLPAPAGAPAGQVAVRTSAANGPGSGTGTGSITVDARGIPAGDILVVGSETSGDARLTGARLTSGAAPSCVSLPGVPAHPITSNASPGGGTGTGTGTASKAG
jgi:hypothetical protein